MKWFCCLLLGVAVLARAAGDVHVGALQAGDEARLREQRQLIGDLAALHLGRGLNGERERDLDTLQQLLDRRILGPGQTAELQAMGVVMGDLLAHELDMHWVIYRDDEGRSRALQLGSSANFLFPVTMISRRVDAGIQVRVREVHDAAVAEMKPWINNRYARPATSR
ncbi:MAG: DUF3806 domain-containing protein [Gammaproteobacteria bacterium]|nr:DUF3806 domain-containing protein [Gammaproteobacteria bacterium]